MSPTIALYVYDVIGLYSVGQKFHTLISWIFCNSKEFLKSYPTRHGCNYNSQQSYKLKADRPHPRDYPPMPPDYRHTDKTLGLVTTTLYSKCEGNCLLLHSASRAPNIDRYEPEIRPWPLTLTYDLDPDLWPWPQSKVTVMPKHDFWDLTLTFDLRPWPTIPS